MEAQTPPPSTAWYDFLGWLDVNKKRVGTGALVVAVVGLIIALVLWRNSEREVEAARALSGIRLPFNPAEPPAPGTADAFARVAEEYSGTAAAPQALLRAGTQYYNDGQWDKAVAQFQKVLGKYGDSPWVAQAQFGIAAALDAQGKNTEAIAKYSDFLKYTTDPAVDQARLNLARVYERANQPALALDVLSKMTNAAPMSQAAGEVQERIRNLYTKHPDLVPKPPVPTNLPPVTPTITPTNIMRVITNAASAVIGSNVPAAPAIQLKPVPAAPAAPAAK